MPNHLINENSPYLLQHAKKTVDWYPWSEEALTKAKSENKPIFLSIGYNACHWCHVMEHESFEDDETAALMSENFVNIKVDREERPDIDSIYMQAVVAMCYVGHGVTLATYLGQQMANGILGKAVNNPFADLHIPRTPLYQDKAWFVNAGKVWYRFLDMIK